MKKRERGELFSTRMIIVLSLVALFFTFSSSASGQSQYNGDDVYVVADVMPAFQGGEKALRDFLYKNIKYPTTAMEKGIEGKVFIKFIVTKDGTIANVTVSRSVDQSLDNEAVRVVKMLPKFQPGVKDGKAVNVWYSMPISFQLKS